MRIPKLLSNIQTFSLLYPVGGVATLYGTDGEERDGVWPRVSYCKRVSERGNDYRSLNVEKGEKKKE